MPSDKYKSIKRNIVIRKLPESANERLDDKVNELLKDGCKLLNVKIDKVERKKSRDDRFPGVIIATAATDDDKKQIMESKSRLKDSRRYSDVIIHNDQTKEERIMSANFRSMIRAYKNGNNNVSVKGLRVVNNDCVDSKISPSYSDKVKNYNDNRGDRQNFNRNSSNTGDYSLDSRNYRSRVPYRQEPDLGKQHSGGRSAGRYNNFKSRDTHQHRDRSENFKSRDTRQHRDSYDNFASRDTRQHRDNYDNMRSCDNHQYQHREATVEYSGSSTRDRRRH